LAVPWITQSAQMFPWGTMLRSDGRFQCVLDHTVEA